MNSFRALSLFGQFVLNIRLLVYEVYFSWGSFHLLPQINNAGLEIVKSYLVIIRIPPPPLPELFNPVLLKL